MIGKNVSVTVDRPLGSYHPDHHDLYYPINYGFIEGIMAPDGEEQDALKKVCAIFRNRDLVPCTGCRYCTEKCPQTLDIPWLVERYNERLFSGGKAVWTLPERAEGKDPAACRPAGARAG